MTLLQAIRIIEMVASQQPSVNMVVENDIFRLNACPSAKYGVFAWTQGQHSASLDSSLTNLAFSFFYVDRLTSDLGNQIEVQSVGMQTIDNIIRRLADYGLEASAYTFTTFNQRFMDECAGVFCSLTLSIPSGVGCAETYGDFDPTDFNEDFFIY